MAKSRAAVDSTRGASLASCFHPIPTSAPRQKGRRDCRELRQVLLRSERLSACAVSRCYRSIPKFALSKENPSARQQIRPSLPTSPCDRTVASERLRETEAPIAYH